MSIPRVSVGLELVDDEGDQVVVCEIDDSDETVELEAADGESYSMTLRELRCKLRDGDFVAVDSDDDSDGEVDDDA